MFKSPINKLNIAQLFFLLFLASLFLQIRYVFPTKEAFQTGAYSDFTSISLYLSDIFLFLTVLFIFPRGKDIKTYLLPLTSLLAWLIIALLYHFSSLSSLNLWFFTKYLELAVSYGTAFCLFNKTDIKALFIKVFLIFSSFESILALWQFVNRTSAGGILHKLGEQVLASNMQGIAKIVSGGTTFVRGYGTFPHPNLLSAFLLVGIMFSIYSFIQAQTTKPKLLYSFLILINTLGLTVTFSRASFLALGVGLIVFFCFLFLPSSSGKERSWRRGRNLAITLTIVSLITSFLIFQPYLSSRATISDSASLERIFYARLGVKMITKNPIFGIGIGESVLHMQQVSPIKLWPWQIQPVHNYFLLAAAEIGIPGALILIWLMLSHLWGLIKKLKSNFNPYLLTLTSILLAFLLLMQFDHYFYTLQQTQMLLWIILGMILAEIKNPAERD